MMQLEFVSGSIQTLKTHRQTKTKQFRVWIDTRISTPARLAFTACFNIGTALRSNSKQVSQTSTRLCGRRNSYIVLTFGVLVPSRKFELQAFASNSKLLLTAFPLVEQLCQISVEGPDDAGLAFTVRLKRRK